MAQPLQAYVIIEPTNRNGYILKTTGMVAVEDEPAALRPVRATLHAGSRHLPEYLPVQVGVRRELDQSPPPPLYVQGITRVTGLEYPSN